MGLARAQRVLGEGFCVLRKSSNFNSQISPRNHQEILFLFYVCGGLQAKVVGFSGSGVSRVYIFRVGSGRVTKP